MRMKLENEDGTELWRTGMRMKLGDENEAREWEMLEARERE